ncbi:MAG TPA: hypothetical protein VFQ45_01575 [Longimicrobium sp.]|nr:hypothetical protein [Longimicrobium sp.]
MFAPVRNDTIIAKLRGAGATEPGRAVRYHPADEAEADAFRALLREGWVLEAEPAHYYTNETVLARRDTRFVATARWAIVLVVVLAGIALGLALLDAP